jgi:hypothetical protein
LKFAEFGIVITAMFGHNNTVGLKIKNLHNNNQAAS